MVPPTHFTTRTTHRHQQALRNLEVTNLLPDGIQQMFRRTVTAATVLGSAALAVAALSGASATASPSVAPESDQAAVVRSATAQKSGHEVARFAMVRSAGAVASGCIPYARARVSIESAGQVEIMTVRAAGLPKNTEFDFFVLQQPNFPFGLGWYQGDLRTNKRGVANATFVGRFNEETFTLGVGVAPAPVRHTSPTADASTNPATAPVHQYHLGFWFNSPEDAAKAGCGANVTPFNGEHNAGAQAMSTRQFGPEDGPLGRIGS